MKVQTYVEAATPFQHSLVLLRHRRAVLNGIKLLRLLYVILVLEELMLGLIADGIYTYTARKLVHVQMYVTIFSYPGLTPMAVAKQY